MILLIVPNPKARQCADMISGSCGEPVEVCGTLREAAGLLSERDFSMAIIDQLLTEAAPREAEDLFDRLGCAVPLHVNFAICGMERVAREARAAKFRRKREREDAHNEAVAALRNQLKDSVTAVLLSCEMALQVPDLPRAAEMKLRSMDDLARSMKSTLGEA